MKKFFSNFFIFIIVLLVSLAAVPWNNLSQWGITVTVLTDYEMYIKGGIGVLALIIGLIYLFIANNEYKEFGYVNKTTNRAAFIPLYIYTIAIMIFGGLINYYIYSNSSSTTNLLILAFFGIVTLNLIAYGYIFIKHFREETNGKRTAHFILLLEFAAIASGLTYWFYTYKLTNYSTIGTYYMILIAGAGILLYFIHLIACSSKSKKNQEIEEMEEEINDLTKTNKKHRSSKHKNRLQKDVVTKDNKKTMIVSNQQTIVSSEGNIDPTNLIYEDVPVDPEFTKTTASDNKPNSIEYYIEKPKMFKSLDPTFDELVAYVREMPNVVTKLDDDRITFYVDRKPFLVLMNLGNYYRMVFKYDLEKGIRLIIKYPTISKNKSTREELWFKANNYGDIPKDIIYQIVKYSYDNVNA